MSSASTPGRSGIRERDWVSDEAGLATNSYWNDLRITGGEHPLTFGANNSGKGVGGGTVHWAAFTPRFHPSDFRIHYARWRRRGLAHRLRRSQALLRTARTRDAGRRTAFSLGRSARLSLWPASHGRRRRHADPRLHAAGHPRVAPAARWRFFPARAATGRTASIAASASRRCKVGAKASTLITHVPDAIAHGAEIRDWSHGLARDPHGAGPAASRESPTSIATVREHFQKAQAVIVAGYAIETPRLLLNSACPGFENGLANSSGYSRASI